MNILMMTNTFSPHVGGVARSIESFSARFRQLGNRVKIIAPTFDNMPEYEPDVIRVHALRNFNHTDFSVSLPIPHALHAEVEAFKPDVIHSHHPFLLGGTALRLAHTHALPLVFTHHTRYEDYTHNLPGDSPGLQRFVQQLATNYANTCDQVFVPSQSMASIIRDRGVTTPVSVVPTGVEVEHFATGDGQAMRKSMGIPAASFVVGHLGRLTKEKNIPFLMQAMAAFLLQANPAIDARVAIFGEGPMRENIQAYFANQGLAERLHLGGEIHKEQVADAYHAMDVFAFSSQSETQGMVITEAMASALPVVALDAPGVREVVRDGLNGYLLAACRVDEFASALAHIANTSQADFEKIKSNALKTAHEFSMQQTSLQALSHYAALRDHDVTHRAYEYPVWAEALQVFESEWIMLMNTVDAARQALAAKESTE